MKRGGSVARRLAVIGGGWAGCAAAVELAGAGHQVSLFEAARSLGGRARALPLHGLTLDNGQHILLGAYSSTLAMLKRVGVRRADAFLTLPLQMRYPQVSGEAGMDFVAAPLPAPFHLALALLRAKGLATADKLSLARFSTSARWMDWTLHHDCSVAELLERFDQTARLTALMWRPLCLAALNTAPERASAQVFLAVLRDSLGASRAASNMLLPRVDLTALFPQAAARQLAAHGGVLRTGAAVSALAQDGDGAWQVDSTAFGSERFDGVVLAVPPPAASKLLGALPLAPLCAVLDAFEYEAITTCYLQYDGAVRLPLPFCALQDDAAAGRHGQFVFDRGQLDGAQAGLLAVVISAAGLAATLDQAALARLLSAQLAAAFGMAALATPRWHQVITDKRATFACTPALARPANASGLAGLVLAGDYTAGEYPATLEGAVRSGVAAARLLGGPA
jgi:squalene-associated FAD-dependent desaturase